MPEKSAILIVDDVQAIRDFCQMALKTDDWDVVTAASGAQALELLESLKFDLVMLDMGLPDMTGLEVCEQIKANPATRRIPILGFTGSIPTTEEKVQGFGLGLVDYLIKPLDAHEIKARVSSILQQKHEQDALQHAYREESERTRRVVEEIKARFLALAENSFDLILEINPAGEVCYCSANSSEILSRPATDLVGKKLFDFVHPHERRGVEKMVQTLFRESGSSRLVFRLENQEKSYRWFEATGKTFTTADGAYRAVLISRDTTEQKERESRLNYLANHDLLTGLLNRNALYELLSDFVTAARKGEHGVMLFMDMDHLKIVNDTVGHTAGDRLIEEVASIIRRTLGEHDVLVRFAGDEFIVLLGKCSEAKGIEKAQNLCKTVGEFPFSVSGQQFHPRLSIGVVMIDGKKSGEELVSSADAACYAAKRKGGDRIEVFEEAALHIKQLQNDSEIQNRIKKAIEQHQLSLWYMPVMSVKNSQVVYFEALLRWQEEDGEFQVPAHFFSVAERYRMSDQLDRHIIQCAIQDLMNHPALKISVNLSGQSLGAPGLSEFVFMALREAKVEPHRIAFEITESAFIENLSAAVQFVSDLQKLGIQFALDDFGRGFSSLSYLKDIPVDLIKIDGAFVRNITTDSLNQAIVQAINLIAHQLKRKTVAEYVSDHATFEKIVALGVDYAQGYYLGSPRPLEHFMNASPTLKVAINP